MPCDHTESAVFFVPIKATKQITAFLRGVDKPKRVRKAISLATEMETIKRKTYMAMNLLS
jgi:hypothetical protein